MILRQNFYCHNCKNKFAESLFGCPFCGSAAHLYIETYRKTDKRWWQFWKPQWVEYTPDDPTTDE